MALIDCDQAIGLNAEYAIAHKTRGALQCELEAYDAAIADYLRYLERLGGSGNDDRTAVEPIIRDLKDKRSGSA